MFYVCSSILSLLTCFVINGHFLINHFKPLHVSFTIAVYFKLFLLWLSWRLQLTLIRIKTNLISKIYKNFCSYISLLIFPTPIYLIHCVPIQHRFIFGALCSCLLDRSNLKHGITYWSQSTHGRSSHLLETSTNWLT